jgi:alkylation response protein AidB-like acyl-CoA dehydrogenase
MDFELTDDQVLLRNSLQKLLADEYSFSRRQDMLTTPFGHSPPVWSLLAEQGVLGAGLPDEYGGFGGPVEAMLVMEEVGRNLVLEPYMSSVVVFGGLIRDLGTEAQRVELLPRIISGQCRGALAHHEPGARYNLSYVETTTRQQGSSCILNGTKTVIQDGAVADIVIVSAQDEAAGGVSLFLVDASEPGLAWTRYRTQDGRNGADITFENLQLAESQLLGGRGTGLAAITQAVDHSIAALCAEAVGAMEALNAATLEYLKTRKQFGQPIGRFQALQHRMVDMFLLTTQAKSMSLLATGRCNDSDPTTRRRALSAAKAFVGKAARFVGQQAVQLHGGIGMTMEYKVGHYFKRTTMIDTIFGDADFHLRELARRGGSPAG